MDSGFILRVSGVFLLLIRLEFRRVALTASQTVNAASPLQVHRVLHSIASGSQVKMLDVKRKRCEDRSSSSSSGSTPNPIDLNSWRPRLLSD
ncbi:hypothetical protein EYF80_060865 [Liparis tanakae]|uniref:Secreted protein n=1 Tax=Liparis tanakae TaxID=230148 RepID=A0A4Z2EJP5_9TELE|nr:hypothetical protein EYF80_060865 [Liparis tanakae]